MAKYIQLYQVKRQLNIDDDFKDDDEYLVDLINVAEQMVETHVDDKLDEIAKANNYCLPKPLIQAMLLFIGNLYANRESIAFASSNEIPLSYSYILDGFKNYSYKTTQGNDKIKK